MTTTYPDRKELNGITLTFPGRADLMLTLIKLTNPTKQTQEVDDTDLTSKVKTSFASAVIDQGEVGAMIRFRPGMPSPVGQVDETIIITYPLLAGQNVAATDTFQGHITKWGAEEANNGTRAETQISIKVNSEPDFEEGHA